MHDDLSMIKNISEHELRNILRGLYELTVEPHNKQRLVFLTGVPGAGKTLALLHTLYKLNQENFNAVFLTGNGPLEKVLSYLLTNASTGAEGDSLIKGVLAYKRAYFDCKSKQPFANSNIPATILFDEAQRAWNEKEMGPSYGMSEPELILKVQGASAAQRGYTNVVASIGFGQSIYKGEEDEFETWVKVIEKPEYFDWEIYAPSMLKGMLSHLQNVIYIEDLQLDTSIRSNFIDTSLFIEAVLDANAEVARDEYRKLLEHGYFIHMVDNLASARSYLEAHARDTGDSFYGLISSSNIILKDHQSYLGNARMIQHSDSKETIGKWYFKNSSKFDAIAPEFVCQGLELNIPVLYFGGDFLMENGRWVVRPTKKYEDPDKTIRNIYRVLLSRGRVGLFIYIPKSKSSEETVKFFETIGIH
jgi:8-oxo-dGTP diphosphatase